eukprot:scaffold250714_cov18-Prasinocladus_malaysianus.AAC.1
MSASYIGHPGKRESGKPRHSYEYEYEYGMTRRASGTALPGPPRISTCTRTLTGTFIFFIRYTRVYSCPVVVVLVVASSTVAALLFSLVLLLVLIVATTFLVRVLRYLLSVLVRYRYFVRVTGVVTWRALDDQETKD